MNAIEIYSKIKEIVDVEDPSAASIALEFIQRETSDRRYQKEVGLRTAAMGGLTCNSVIDPELRVAAIIRQAIREELDAPKAPTPEAV